MDFPVDLPVLLAFSAASLALLVIPGPTIIMVVAQALAHGRRVALASVAGVALGDLLAASLSLVGVGTILAASATAFTVVKLVGAVYLVYVGVQILRKARQLASMGVQDTSLRALMRRDFTIAISNPKAIAVFTAFFPQFVDPTMPAWNQLAQMGAAFLVMEVGAVALYVLAGVFLGRLIRSQRVFVHLNRLVGAALIVSGGTMAFSRH